MEENTQSDNQLVAVYGSLRSGLQNSSLLNGSELKSTETVNDYGVTRYGTSYFPVAFPFEGASLVVEVYSVDEKTMDRLDMLEGYPTFYNRVKVDTSQGEAWLYVIEDQANRVKQNPEILIEDGDWVAYTQEN